MMARPRRTPRERETAEFLQAAERFIRAAGRRVGEGDEPELQALLALEQVLDDAIAEAVRGQKTRRSWAAIALATGKTRQAAQQRWGSPS